MAERPAESAIAVRPFRDGDHAFLAGIAQRLHPGETASPRDPEVLARFFADLAGSRLLSEPGAEAFVAVCDGLPAGVIAVHPDSDYFTEHPTSIRRYPGCCAGSGGKGRGQRLDAACRALGARSRLQGSGARRFRGESRRAVVLRAKRLSFRSHSHDKIARLANHSSIGFSGATRFQPRGWPNAHIEATPGGRCDTMPDPTAGFEQTLDHIAHRRIAPETRRAALWPFDRADPRSPACDRPSVRKLRAAPLLPLPQLSPLHPVRPGR